MNSAITHRKTSTDSNSYTKHPAIDSDKVIIAGLKALVLPQKGTMRGTRARAPYDIIMSRVVVPEGVTYEPDTIAGVAGWWCRVPGARKNVAILHLHGGWFNWGSAQAFCHLVGHIAARADVDAFIPDYRLAPENPFPAALQDAQACYRGLVGRGCQQIAITGDSAGGCLALVLLATETANVPSGGTVPAGTVALSPVTDLSLTQASWETRADADPYFTKAQVIELVHAYVRNADSTNPLVSPLYGDLTGLPPIRIHVGDDEVLLDDALSYIEGAVAAGVDARIDVWHGMPHGFLSGVGKMAASNLALEAIGLFLTERLGATHQS